MCSLLAMSRIPGFASLFWVFLPFLSPVLHWLLSGYMCIQQGNCKAAGNLWEVVILKELLFSTLKLVSHMSPRSLCAG